MAEDAAGLLIPEELPPDHRSGFVAVVGRPSVGKSTLVNQLLGQKIAIVSPRPQTTRTRLLGILTRDDAQIIFVDTPGIHKPLHRLGEMMVETASASIPDADVILWVVDITVAPTDEDRQVAGLIRTTGRGAPVVLALNKSDVVESTFVAARTHAYEALVPGALPLLVSALTGDGLDDLLQLVIHVLPLGPRYYPEEQVTDQQERFIAAELIREQVLLQLRQEVPYAVAVAVQEFKQRSADMTYISAVLYVERDSQKGIVLGKDGQALKRIGQAARASIEKLLGTRVYLELWVKVRPNWRKKDEELSRLGYTPPRD
jgi:GTP-binding protein Era